MCGWGLGVRVSGWGSTLMDSSEATVEASMISIATCESGPLRAVHLSHHKWPGGVDTFTQPSGILVD